MLLDDPAAVPIPTKPAGEMVSLSEYELPEVSNFKVPPSTPINANVPSSPSVICINPAPPDPLKFAAVFVALLACSFVAVNIPVTTAPVFVVTNFALLF